MRFKAIHKTKNNFFLLKYYNLKCLIHFPFWLGCDFFPVNKTCTGGFGVTIRPLTPLRCIQHISCFMIPFSFFLHRFGGNAPSFLSILSIFSTRYISTFNVYHPSLTRMFPHLVSEAAPGGEVNQGTATSGTNYPHLSMF